MCTMSCLFEKKIFMQLMKKGKTNKFYMILPGLMQLFDKI